MKKYDNDFLELLAEYSPEAEPISEQETKKLNDLVAGKVKLNNNRISFKPFLIAAAIGVSLLMAAAGYKNVSGAFKDVLKEQDTNGKETALSGVVPVVEKSGNLVGETVSADGIDVTVRGVVGDADSLKILVDVVQLSGNPLAFKRADETLSDGEIAFGKVNISYYDNKHPIDNGDWRSSFIDYSQEVISTDPSGSKLTMMITMDSKAAKSMIGKTVNLSLENLMQWVIMPSLDVGMAEDDLYDTVSQFGPLTDEDFRMNGYSYSDETGGIVYNYEIITETDLKIPLAPDLPGYYVTNAAVKDETLYLQGTISPRQVNEKLHFSSMFLYNPKTNDTITFAMSCTDNINWSASFSGIDSLESLRGYVLKLNVDGMYPIQEGNWEFDVPLEFENTTRVFFPNEEFNIGSFDMTAKELTISPYNLSLRTAFDNATFEKMMYKENPVTVDWSPIAIGVSAWDKLTKTENATLNMIDGSQIQVPVGGYSARGDASSCSATINFDLRIVIPFAN